MNENEDEILQPLNDELFLDLSIEELEARLSAENLEDRAVLACWVHCDTQCIMD